VNHTFETAVFSSLVEQIPKKDSITHYRVIISFTKMSRYRYLQGENALTVSGAYRETEIQQHKMAAACTFPFLTLKMMIHRATF